MSGSAGAVFFILLLLQIPMGLRVLRVMSRFGLNRDATSFVGRYRRWKVTYYTGRVSFSGTYAEHRTYTHVDATGRVPGSTYTVTDTHDKFRLTMRGGQIKDVHLVNFSAMVYPGDVVTVAACTKGRKSRWFAVLNHTSDRSFYNDVDLHEITSPRQILLVFNIIFTGLTILGLITDGLYVLFERRQRRNFKWNGMAPLRRVAAPEAAVLAAV